MVTKRTVNELLRDYMDSKMVDEDTAKDILKQLHKNIKKGEDGEDISLVQ
ncbi:unnamed protein product [marine sediment metagenome]|uniref:Uncharacterized protein n=1 Tax=marine sediment metagenome TaxID=412755 RepID=X1E6L3_9ZZZZ